LYPKPPDTPTVTAQKSETMNNSASWGELAADCIINKSRLMSDRSDEARSVAIAILEACRSDLESLETVVYEEAQKANPNDEDLPSSWVADTKAAETKAAIRYVVEARSGHCTTHRLSNGVPYPSGYATIQRE
jgi:hypothetical protein